MLPGWEDHLDRLHVEFDALPPKAVDVGGLPRSRNRQLQPDEALRFAQRGLPILVLSFDGCGFLESSRLPALLKENAAAFAADGASDPEAQILMYGKRVGKEDQRVVVVAFTS